MRLPSQLLKQDQDYMTQMNQRKDKNPCARLQYLQHNHKLCKQLHLCSHHCLNNPKLAKLISRTSCLTLCYVWKLLNRQRRMRSPLMSKTLDSILKRLYQLIPNQRPSCLARQDLNQLRINFGQASTTLKERESQLWVALVLLECHLLTSSRPMHSEG